MPSPILVIFFFVFFSIFPVLIRLTESHSFIFIESIAVYTHLFSHFERCSMAGFCLLDLLALRSVFFSSSSSSASCSVYLILCVLCPCCFQFSLTGYNSRRKMLLSVQYAIHPLCFYVCSNQRRRWTAAKKRIHKRATATFHFVVVVVVVCVWCVVCGKIRRRFRNHWLWVS